MSIKEVNGQDGDGGGGVVMDGWSEEGKDRGKRKREFYTNK